MTDTIENQTTDVEHDDESGVSLETLDHLLGARLHPVWWGSFRDAPDFADDSTISDAYEELADRVKGVAGLLWQSDIDAWDAVKAGQVLHDLAREAETLQTLWRSARRQLAEHKTVAAEKDDAPAVETTVKALLDRYMRRLIDVYPFHLATNLYGVALYARSGDAAELERCLSHLEVAIFPACPSGEIVAPPAVSQEGERFEGATHVPGDDYLPIQGEPEGLMRDLNDLFDVMFPKELSDHFYCLLNEAIYRDWPALEKSMKAIQRHRLGGALNA